MAGVLIQLNNIKKAINKVAIYCSVHKYQIYGNNSTKRVNCLILLFLNVNNTLVVINYQYEKFIALNGIQCDFW